MTKEEKIAALNDKTAAYKADLIATLELPETNQNVHSAFNDLTRCEIRLETYLQSLPA